MPADRPGYSVPRRPADQAFQPDALLIKILADRAECFCQRMRGMRRGCLPTGLEPFRQASNVGNRIRRSDADAIVQLISNLKPGAVLNDVNLTNV